MYKLRLTTDEGISFPADLQNLSKSEAKKQLDLLSEKTLKCDFSVDMQGWDVVCLNYPNGEFELYEIVRQ